MPSPLTGRPSGRNSARAAQAHEQRLAGSHAGDLARAPIAHVDRSARDLGVGPGAPVLGDPAGAAHGRHAAAAVGAELAAVVAAPEPADPLLRVGGGAGDRAAELVTRLAAREV